MVAEEVATDLALEVEDGAAAAELTLALDEARAEDLTAEDEVTADCFATEETTEEAAEVLAGAAMVVVGELQPQPKPKTQKNRLSSDFSASTATGAAEVNPARPR